MVFAVVALVSTALIRVGRSAAGIVSGSVLEAGTRTPPTTAAADTM